MVFNDCDYRLTKNIDIEEILIRVINAYFRQDSD
jgi:hypothetical protein